MHNSFAYILENQLTPLPRAPLSLPRLIHTKRTKSSKQPCWRLRLVYLQTPPLPAAKTARTSSNWHHHYAIWFAFDHTASPPPLPHNGAWPRTFCTSAPIPQLTTSSASPRDANPITIVLNAFDTAPNAVLPSFTPQDYHPQTAFVDTSGAQQLASRRKLTWRIVAWPRAARFVRVRGRKYRGVVCARLKIAYVWIRWNREAQNINILWRKR